jgi:HlyD family secretion protein
MAIEKKKKLLVLLAVIFIAAVVSVSIVLASIGRNQGILVDVQTVEKGEITVRVPAKGVLEEVEKQMIFNESSGKILSIQVEEGDEVKEGQILAILDTADLSNKLQIKKKMLEIDRIELSRIQSLNQKAQENRIQLIKESERALEDAKKQLEISEKLYVGGAISKMEYEKSFKGYEETLRAYETAKNDRDEFGFDMEKILQKIAISQLEIKDFEEEMEKQMPNITSPMNGVVTAINVEEGAFSNPAVPSFVISDITNLKIEINVSEYDIAKVKMGQEVEIETEALTGQVFKGLVEKIAPVAKRVTTGQITETMVPVTINVKEKEELLKPGFSVNTRIIAEEKKDVIVVPFDSIITEQEGTKIIYIVKEGILHRIEVETGIESDFEIEVTRGLTIQDQIVLNPSPMLKEGITVKINAESRRNQ